MKNNGGTEFPNNFRLFNDNVKASRGILIHLGNFPKNTHGCLLPGSDWKPDYITGGTSENTVLRINSYINNTGVQNVKFNIFNVIQ